MSDDEDKVTFKGLHLIKDKENPDLTDPLEVLDLLKEAILHRDVDKKEVARALRQVLQNFEQQNRVFLIAAANAELPRVLRLLNFINAAEEELFSDKRLKNSTNRELARMYALAQANLLSGVDRVKQVADMRLDALRAAGGVEGVDRIFDMEKDEELNALAGLPTLDAPGRDKVRKLVDGLVKSINDDDSVEEDDESDNSDSDD